MHFYFEALLYGALLPAAMFAAGLIASGRACAGKEGCAKFCRALAFGAGFLTGYVALGWAPLVPVDAWHWLAYLPLAAAFSAPLPIWLGMPLLALGSALLLVPSWEDFPRAAWMPAVGLSVLLLGILRRLARTQSGPFPVLLWVVSFLAAAALLVLSGNAKLAQLAGVVAALLGVALVASWFRLAVLEDIMGSLAVLLPGLLLNGRFGSFSEVPLASYLLVAYAPLGGGLLALPVCKRLSPRRRRIVQLGAVLVPAALGVALGWFATASDGDEW